MKKICTTALGLIVIMAVICSCASCNHTKKTSGENVVAEPVGPTFNEDSAYAFCQQQCNFGPRAMNTPAHEQCKDWIIEKFRAYGCVVEAQQADLPGYDGTVLKATNIIARTSTDKTKPHILLCAHYDSRPWADNDAEKSNHHQPIIGANDGASGIAVMMEVARLLQQHPLQNVAVDFVCFDAEDWGTPQWSEKQSDESWALGSRHWSTNHPYKNDYTIPFGILLDMVGGTGARFYQEAFSLQYAQTIVNKVWNAAASVGYSGYFPTTPGGYVTDDHVPVNEIAGIPTVDIVPYYPDCRESSFGPTWHTVADNMDNIDRNTLKAVGQTVIQVLYSE